MATSRTATLSLWKLGGFPNHHALEKALAELRTARLMRRSGRGGAAQQLDASECAVVAVAMRGEANATDTAEFCGLVSASGTRLVERIAALITAGAEAILAGAPLEPVTVTLCSDKSATLAHAGQAELYRSALGADASSGILKSVTITPDVWGALCDLCADSMRRGRPADLAHQGARPGEAMPENETTAALPGSAVVPRGRLQPGKAQTHRHRSSVANAASPHNKQFVCARAGGLPPQKEGQNEARKIAAA